MSQQGRLRDIESALDTLTGNTGGAVGPDGSGNINIVGSAPFTVTGNPGTFTLTISGDGTLPSTFTADSGSATPSGDNLNLFGTSAQGLTTSGAGDTVTFTNADATTSQKGVLETSTNAESILGAATDIAVTPASLGAKLGDQTDRAVPYGQGSSFALGWTDALDNGELVIGSSSGSPAAATLASADGTVTITNGANSIDLSAGAAVAIQFDTDSGSAVPSSGVIQVLGGTLLGTTGGTNIVTVNADDNVVGSVGSDSGSCTPSSNTFTITGSGGITTSASGSTVTIIGTSEQVVPVTLLDDSDSTYTVLTSDYYLSCDVSMGVLVLDLPDAPTTGSVWIVKDSTGSALTNNITVTTTGGVVTIDGSTTFVMNTNYEAANFLFNGTSYEVF